MTSESSDNDTSHRSSPTPVSEENNVSNEVTRNSMPDKLLSGIRELTSAYTEGQWQSMTYTHRLEQARGGLREACENELVDKTRLIDWIEKSRAAHPPDTNASTEVQHQIPSQPHPVLTRTQRRNMRRSRKRSERRAKDATLAPDDGDYDLGEWAEEETLVDV